MATPTAAKPSPDIAAQARALEAIHKRLARGEKCAVAEVEPLTRSPEPQVRGLARRALAHVLVDEARRGARGLMIEACHDFDFQHPQVLLETLARLADLEEHDTSVKLSLRAAERLSAQGELDAALICILNAAGTDIGHGSKAVRDPSVLRRIIRIYEQVAQQAAGALSITPATRSQRRSPATGKLRLGHVAGQICDGGHAPSRAIETLLRFADRTTFDHFLVVTDSMVRRAPLQIIASQDSRTRGGQRLKMFTEELDVPVIIPTAADGLLVTAARLHAAIAHQQIDVLFYHGSIATPIEWLLCAWQAAPWQLDAGFGVPLHCPAVDYQFFEFRDTMESLAFWCRERGVPYGSKPTGADMSATEQAAPFARAEIGIPEDHVVLGTVGNHLTHRMSERFCHTVANVLRQRPKTTFVVIGSGDFANQARWFGDDLCSGTNGQPAQVRFTGPSSQIPRWTKTFDIYVNSYPEGGGYSIADAMAGACPVVAMAVDDSSLALAAKVWIGDDNIVTPATDEAFAARLRTLIDDPDQRTDMGQHLYQRYKDEYHPTTWVRRNTDCILSIIRGDNA
jgi:glycosyltransferase involved in cell wall biosynthesis